jgi:hypothetical protein
MKKIAFAFIAALAVLSFAGCKKKDAVKEAMAKVEGFKNDMCKCKAGDKACAEKVQKDMLAWADSMKGKMPDEKSMSDADKKKGEENRKEMEKCQNTAMGTGDMAAPPAGGDMKGGDTAAPPAGGDMKGGDMKGGDTAAPPAGGDMKKEEPKKEEPKK